MRKDFLTKTVLLVAIITAGIAVRRPYLLSGPIIANQWHLFLLVSRVLPIYSSVVLILSVIMQDERRRVILLRFASISVVLLWIVCSGYFAISLYLLWRVDAFGKYLLPPYSNYFANIIWRFVLPYGYGLATAAGFTAIFFLIRRLRGNHILSQSELWMSIFMSLLLGFGRSMIALFAGLLFSLTFLFFTRLVYHKESLRLIPGFAIGIYIAMFWGQDILWALGL